jgi:hypothetical protein
VLAFESLSHDFTKSVGKSKEPSSVVTTINARNQLVTHPKKAHSGLYID